MAIEINLDVWIPFRVINATTGAGVTGQNAAALSSMRFNQLTQSGITSTAFTEVDTALADYEVNEIGNGDYEVMIPGSGGATANNDLAAICWVTGSASGGALMPFPITVIDPTTSDQMVNYFGGTMEAAQKEDIGDAVAEALTPQFGQLQAASSSTATLATSASTTVDYYANNGARPSVIVMITGDARGEDPHIITDYTTGRVATISPNWTNTPAANDWYALVAIGSS